jgi:hypothetical protein
MFRRRGFVPRVAGILLGDPTRDVAEHVVRVLDSFSQHGPSIVAEEADLACFVRQLGKLAPPEQKAAVSALLRVTCLTVPESNVKVLADLAALVTHHDRDLATAAASALANIGRVVADLGAVSDAALTRMAIGIQCVSEEEVALKLLRFMDRLIERSDFANILMGMGIDFELIVDRMPEIVEDIQRFIARLCVPPDGWSRWFVPRILPNSRRFLADVAPFIEHLFLSKVGNIELSLALLAATARFVPPRNNEAVIGLLTKCSLFPGLSDGVRLVSPNLLRPISQAIVVSSADQFHQAVNLPPTEFFSRSGSPACCSYLRTNGPVASADLSTFASLHRDLFSIPPCARRREGGAFLCRTIAAMAPAGQAAVPIGVDFAFCEGAHHPRGDVPCHPLVPQSEMSDFEKCATIARAMHVPGWNRFSDPLTCGGSSGIFSSSDSIFQAFASLCGDYSATTRLRPSR